MGLDESVDCDGSCSGLDTVGMRIVSHKECERAYRDAIARLPSERLSRVSKYVERTYSAVCSFLYNLGF
jgi:hypothetical protein